MLEKNWQNKPRQGKNVQPNRQDIFLHSILKEKLSNEAKSSFYGHFWLLRLVRCHNDRLRTNKIRRLIEDDQKTILSQTNV